MKPVQLFLGINRNCLELQNEGDQKGKYAAFEIPSVWQFPKMTKNSYIEIFSAWYMVIIYRIRVIL